MKKLLPFFIISMLLAGLPGCHDDDDSQEGVNRLHVIDFEDSRVEDYLAGPTAYGENLYESYTGNDKYTGYDDATTGLLMLINEDDSGARNFWNGGIAISRWNNTTGNETGNQCSVYYSDPVTGKGGYGGSSTFAIHGGYSSASSYSDGRSYITFGDPTKTCVFDYFYVNNTTYTALAMRDGNDFSTPLSHANEGWFKLIVEGIAPDGSVTGTVEFYLADFRSSSSPGIVTEWTWVDLSSLGEVTALRFNMQGSDVGEYGLNTPAYFAFDNLAVKLP
jgi:hypothetical protein